MSREAHMFYSVCPPILLWEQAALAVTVLYFCTDLRLLLLSLVPGVPSGAMIDLPASTTTTFNILV